MANLQLSTASNHPIVPAATAEAIQDILDSYVFHPELTAELWFDDHGDYALACHGYADMRMVSQEMLDAEIERLTAEGAFDGEDTDDPDFRHQFAADFVFNVDPNPHIESFMVAVAEALGEPFIVQTVGFEKCRFPHLSGEHIALPDGTFRINCFEAHDILREWESQQ